MDFVSETRGIKTINNVSLKTKIKEINVEMEKELVEAFNHSKKDLKASLFIENINFKNKDINFKIYDYSLE